MEPLHFRLCGYSYVAVPFQETTTEPPKAGEWTGRDSYYRIELTGFTELENALSVPEFLKQHGDMIKQEKEAGTPKYYPFAEYRDGLRLAVCYVKVIIAEYGDLGHEYIECHHLNPLSERPGEQDNQTLTTLDDVAVLCANCHRMVHRRRPTLSLEQLRMLLFGKSTP